MNREQKAECDYIRSLSSEEAANWLMAKYETLPYSISHRSWEKKDALRLTHFYIRGALPNLHGGVSEHFLRFLTVKKYVNVLNDYLHEIEPSKVELFISYVGPSLRKFSKTEKDNEIVTEFLNNLKSLVPEKK